jgi:medium-chain acyl-[acyl-carrier-protein] hydrolase
MTPAQPNRWIAPYKPRPSARVRLLCLPFAGGNASVYWTWSRALPPEIEVCPVELPGRGARFSEPSFRSMPALVTALADGLEGWLDRPFAFYGHSMGALIAFELAHELRARGQAAPVALLLGAGPAPTIPRRLAVADWTDAELIAAVRRISDQPEMLDHPELAQLALPMIRNDLTVCVSYAYQVRPKLACPITVFGGVDDEIGGAELDAWQAETTGPFDVEMMQGGHFFLRTCCDALCEGLARRLGALASPLAPLEPGGSILS